MISDVVESLLKDRNQLLCHVFVGLFLLSIPGEWGGEKEMPRYLDPSLYINVSVKSTESPVWWDYWGIWKYTVENRWRKLELVKLVHYNLYGLHFPPMFIFLKNRSRRHAQNNSKWSYNYFTNLAFRHHWKEVACACYFSLFFILFVILRIRLIHNVKSSNFYCLIWTIEVSIAAIL